MGGVRRWTEHEGALDRHALRDAAGRRPLRSAAKSPAQERNDLTHFIDHGWLVWRAAIDPDLIDRFAADIRNHHQHPANS